MVLHTLRDGDVLDTPGMRGLGATVPGEKGRRAMRGLTARSLAAHLAGLLLASVLTGAALVAEPRGAAAQAAPGAVPASPVPAGPGPANAVQPAPGQPAPGQPAADGPLSPREAAEAAAERALQPQAPAPRSGQPDAAAPAPALVLPAADAARLAETLRDERRRNELLSTLDSLARAAAVANGADPAPAAPPPAAQPESALPLPLAPQSLLAQLLLALSNTLGHVSAWVVAAARSANDLPAVLEAGQRFLFDQAVRDRAFSLVWKALVVLAAGIAVERALVVILRPARRRIASAAEASGRYGHRVGLSLARFVVDLVPVIAFAAVSYAVITAIERWPSQRVLLIVANNAYLAARLARAIGRAVFAPEVPHLRMVPMADETAAYCQVWLQRLTVWTVTGYAVAEATLIFGLGQAAHDGLVKFVEFVLMLFLVLIVLQNRAALAAVIRAPDEARGPWAVARNRLADVWHLLAVAYLFAGWAVSALQISDGYAYLLRFTASTIAVLGAAKLAEIAADRLLARVLRVEPDLTGRYPGLEGRVNRYTPVLRTLVHAAIWATATVVMLQLWGLGAFEWFQHGRLGARVVAALASVLFTLVLALLVWESINSAINRHLEKLSRDAEAARTARVRTLLPMLRTALLFVMIVVVALIVLHELGVNIAPLLAGAGVIGIAIGFGSQKLVQDVITGVFLLAEDAIAVGDVVNVAGQGGVVEALSIRSIRLRSVDGTVHIVPFSAVTTVSNMTKDFAFAVFDIGVAYGEDTDKVVEVLRELGAEMRAEPRWANVIREPLEVMGVDRFMDSAVVIRCRFRTNPGSQWAVSREFNRRYKKRFDEVGIEIPFPYRKVVVQSEGGAPISAEAKQAAAIAGAA
jgi:small conductance mechanosensitive channel